jgi:hypothetical protein
MTTPNFTAETALYRTSRSYRTMRHTTRDIASATLYPAQFRRIMSPEGGQTESPDAFASGTCSSACCGLCTCCANSGGAACCRYCSENCG